MTNEAQVKDCLAQVMVPGVLRSIVDMNLVRGIDIDAGQVKVTLANTALNQEAQDFIAKQITALCKLLPEVETSTVDFTEVSAKDLNEVKNVIAVMSGKGGVGKSLVTGLIAMALQRNGASVGILDADITGPSIPRLFGLADERAGGSQSGMLPARTHTGISVMSMNLLLPNEDDAVIWRGPLIGKVITQFWEEVLWGKLDYLIVDLPPGTADAPLTVMQSLPIQGVVIVFTPQDLTAMVVRKAIKMAEQMKKPILGVVENMSYLHIPEMNKKMELFGASRGEEMARAAHAPLLARLPIDPDLVKLCDSGNLEDWDSEDMEALSDALYKVLSLKNNQP